MRADNRLCEYIFIWMCVSLLAPECVVWPCVCVCLCVLVCVIPNQSTSKKPHYVSDLSKLYALLH